MLVSKERVGIRVGTVEVIAPGSSSCEVSELTKVNAVHESCLTIVSRLDEVAITMIEYVGRVVSV